MRSFFSFCLFLLIVLSGRAEAYRATANDSLALEGVWLQLDKTGSPTLYGKMFLPESRLYGFCMSRDFKSMSTWMMADYKVQNDSVYHEHVFFHSSINYQRDITMHYRMLNDSTLATDYTDVYPNGQKVTVAELWRKVNTPMDVWTEDTWHSAYQEAQENFGRLPNNGQSLEEKGTELYGLAEEFIQKKQIGRANETLLIRAEMDTTNLDWQLDVLNFYLSINAAPAMAEKISNRAIRLSQSLATSHTDSIMFKAYVNQAFLFHQRGNNGLEETIQSARKAIDIEKASNRPARKVVGLLYFLMASSYMGLNDFESTANYARQCIDVFEKSLDVSNAQKAEGYYLLAIALWQSGQYRKANEELIAATQLLVGENGQQQTKLSLVNLLRYQNYRDLLEKSPHDKNALKEFQAFMADKMVCAEIADRNNEWGLLGSYYVLEADDWDMEHLVSMNGDDAKRTKHYLLQKDGVNYRVNLKEGQKLNANMHVVTVDGKWKKQILRQWKKSK